MESNGENEPIRSSGSVRRRVPTLGLICVVLLVAAGGLLYVRVEQTHEPRVKWCEGVGLLGPPAATPSDAFAAWLNGFGEQPGEQPPASEWERQGSTFTNQTYARPGGYGFRSVSASPGGHGWPSGTTPYGPDQWSIEGGCV